MSGAGKKIADVAVKASKGIDWDAMGKLIVSEEARKEFNSLRRAFDEVNHTIQTKYSLEPEPIDWEYYRKGIGSRLVDMYKEAYESTWVVLDKELCGSWEIDGGKEDWGRLSHITSPLHFSVPGILFTPICPHSLSFRPLILPEHVTLRVQVPFNSRGDAWASFDGKDRKKLEAGDALVCSMAPWPVPTACQVDSTNDFLRSIHEGLHWNVRKSQSFDGPRES